MGTKHVYSIYVKCFFSVVPLVMLCIKHIHVYILAVTNPKMLVNTLHQITIGALIQFLLLLHASYT
jgi:hypothetical protein